MADPSPHERSVAKDDRIVGSGLLRLLADTMVLHFKTRHVCWRARGALDLGLSRLIREDHAVLNASADGLAHEIVRLGVAIPGDFRELVAMSSIAPPDGATPPTAAVGALGADHRTIVADIETLRVTLPLARRAQTKVLLDALEERHAACAAALDALWARAGEATT